MPSEARQIVLPIVTIPRSGTWWNKYFFHFYVYLRRGRTNVPVLHRDQRLMDYRDVLGGYLDVCHAICPGFVFQEWERSADWNALAFTDPGYNYGSYLMKENIQVYDITRPHHPGCVYIYRNPLDHFVSIYEQSLNNEPDLLKYRDADGAEKTIESPNDLARVHGVHCYIKQYLTFKWMSERFPGKIRMTTYESMRAEPAAYFASVFEMWGVTVDEGTMREAMHLSSPDQLKKLEQASGFALGGAKSFKGKTHMRGGQSGKWREHFDADQVASIASRFKEHGLDLDSFIGG